MHFFCSHRCCCFAGNILSLASITKKKKKWEKVLPTVREFIQISWLLRMKNSIWLFYNKSIFDCTINRKKKKNFKIQRTQFWFSFLFKFWLQFVISFHGLREPTNCLHIKQWRCTCAGILSAIAMLNRKQKQFFLSVGLCHR